MKKMKSFILCLIVLVFLPCVTASSLNFPNIIWVYWETDFEKAPLITRVSYEKLILAATEVNWTVTLVTGKNIHEYISNIEEFNEVVRKGKRQTIQQKSDLLRIWLIQENGGVWIDFALIPLQNFAWLKDYSSYQHMIINRMGTNLDDPNMLMLGEGWHQSPLSQYNSDGALVADEYFGMAIHFIAAKKKVPIMTDWKNKMKTVSALSYKQMLPQWKKYRLYFHNIDRGDVYYSGNIALESALQLKQLQIDKNLTLFSKHLSVYEHQKIWCIHGEVGPIGFTRGHALKTSDFFMFTRQQVEERAGQQRFYIKIPAYLRSGIQGQFSKTKSYLDQRNKSVEQIIKNGPTPEECHLMFIVQGSILHNFYQGSKYFEQLKVPIITVQQRDMLRQKCISFNPEVYKPIYQKHSTGSLVSPEREMYAKDPSIKTKLWVWWVTHNLSIHEWMEKYRGPVLLIALYGVLKLFFGSFLTTLVNRNNSFINVSHSQQGIHSGNKFLKLNVILSLAFVSVMYMVFYQLFECIQYHGKFPIYNYIAFMAVVMIGIHEFVKRQKDNFGKTGASWFVPLQTIDLASRMFLLIYAGHCVLMHFHIMWFYAYRDVLLIIGMGYLLYVMFLQMQKRRLVENKFHQWVVYLMGSILPCSIVGFFCLVAVWRNPMYLTSGDHYVRLGFINNLGVFFNLFSKVSIGYFLIVLANNVIISFKPEQSQKDISPRLLRQQSIIFILSSIYWLATYTTISNKYEVMEESFTSYDHILYMKYFMLHFAVLDFALRLKMPEQLALKYKIALYTLSFGYTIVFCVFGFDIFPYLFADDFKKKVHFCVLTFLVAFLALVWEVLTTQYAKEPIQKINYEETNELNQISMTDVRTQN